MTERTLSTDRRGERANGESADPHSNASTAEATNAGLYAEDIAVGYPATDEPVVECDTVLVPEGEITAFVGPNGSGKSTLLRAFADELDPERGRVLLDGEELRTFGSKELARKLGVLFQENESPGGLTVEDLAYHGRYPHRGFFDPVGDEDAEAVERALDLAGVTHLRDDALDTLSGGQKQLAWLAMVLAQETDVLLLDEPTTFLDLHHQLRVLEVVRTLNREGGLTVAVVLHDLEQAARFADNLVALRDGEVYDWGPPGDVVSEGLLRDVFRVDAGVDVDGPGGPTITPRRAIDDGG